MKHSQSRMAAVALALVVVAATVSAAAAVSHATSSTLNNEHITNGPIAEYLAADIAEIAWSTRGSAQMNIRYGLDREHLAGIVIMLASTDCSRTRRTTSRSSTRTSSPSESWELSRRSNRVKLP